MALKITKSIGCDKGITNEAYVRIADYQISKSGNANFRIQLYMSEADATPASASMGPMGGDQARNQAIGEYLSVPLTKQVEETKTRTMMRPVETEVTRTRTVTNEAGEEVSEEYTVMEYSTEEVTEEYTVTNTVPDLSSAEGVDIFAFGYSHLKAKLVSLFSAAKVEDC
jgi:hypothetical protein